MTTPKDTWISVKDAMPRNAERVIVFTGTQPSFATCHIEDGGYVFYSNTMGHVINVTHWMLLSKPKKTN